MNINEYLQRHFSQTVYPDGYRIKNVTPMVYCTDGFSMSVQASHGHYCEPRVDGPISYSEVEVGFPSSFELELLPYDSGDGVYAYVPVEVVDAIIQRHRGFALI